MTLLSLTRALAVAASALLIAGTNAYAEKPDKGNGNGNSGKNKSEQHEKGNKSDKGNKGNKGGNQNSDRDDSRGIVSGGTSISFSFGSSDTRLVRDYYRGQAAKGKCPPGLAKKGNGCQPPGQAKQWQKGRSLGSDIRYYDIPNELRIRLPAPPLNHKYVQVGADLLLIAVGTAIVVDAIADIL